VDDLCAILKVSRTASADEIRSTIHRELRVWTQRNNAPVMEKRLEAERMIKPITEAEPILCDPGKLADYDSHRDATVRMPTQVNISEDASDPAFELLVEKAIHLSSRGPLPTCDQPAQKSHGHGSRKRGGPADAESC
jgi:curved DNA-binding protein CbpA